MPPTNAARAVSSLQHHRLLFSLLVLINVFVGGMVGLERTVLSLIAEVDFGITSTVSATAFIITFGVTKAGVNFFAGKISELWGRRRLLLLGWLFGLPIPFLLIFARDWGVVLLANVLLGANQALTWSMTVVMKVDIAGPRQRGLAIGLNEFAGYFGLSLVAFFTGMIANRYGLRPEPFYLGIGLAMAGIVLSLFAEDTRNYARAAAAQNGERLPLSRVLRTTTWTSRPLASSCFAGLVTNFKDGLLWGLLPLYLSTAGVRLSKIGIITATYPVVWSILQLIFGPLSDRLGRKWLVSAGMLLQGSGLVLFARANAFPGFLFAAAVTGVGTAMVYPTLLARVADHAAAPWRATALGVYRFWRDIGYAVGALATGIIAGIVRIPGTMLITAAMAGVAALLVAAAKE